MALLLLLLLWLLGVAGWRSLGITSETKFNGQLCTAAHGQNLHLFVSVLADATSDIRPRNVKALQIIQAKPPERQLPCCELFFRVGLMPKCGWAVLSCSLYLCPSLSRSCSGATKPQDAVNPQRESSSWLG